MSRLRQAFRVICGFCASFTAPAPAPLQKQRRHAVDTAGRASGYQWMRCVD